MLLYNGNNRCYVNVRKNIIKKTGNNIQSVLE